MNCSTRKLTQKLVAVILIVVLLQLVGVAPPVIIFLVGAGLFVSYTARRAELKETQRVFAFYIAADEILRNEEREWYGFEIAQVINDGGRVLNSMPDPPSLCYFAVGALCHRAGDYAGAIEHLAPMQESEWLDATRQANPSPQLRRYVDFLRSLEREPATAPQILGAVRNLERMRKKHAAQWLLESRDRVAKAEQPRAETFSYVANQTEGVKSVTAETLVPLSAIVPPPSIAEVLHDVYNDEQKAS